MEWSEPASRDKIPAGKTNHSRKAAPSPQINPAPELVARGAKKRPKASPNRAPSKVPLASDVVRSALPSAPPAPPTARPSSGSLQSKDLAPLFICAARIELEGMDLSSLQVDRLNDIARKEEFDRPVHKYANLSFQPR